MYSWSISVDVINSTSCLVGFYYREGTYKKSEKDTEIRQFSEFNIGFLLVTITVKVFFN